MANLKRLGRWVCSNFSLLCRVVVFGYPWRNCGLADDCVSVLASIAIGLSMR
jgi:hypothetical protein